MHTRRAWVHVEDADNLCAGVIRDGLDAVLRGLPTSIVIFDA